MKAAIGLLPGLFFAALLAISTAGFVQAPASVDLLIASGMVLDGTGNPWFRADVGIAGDKIVFVGDASLYKIRAKKRIDASGLYVAPGFIDVHTHTAAGLSDLERRPNKNYLYQGVTTVVTGNDGSSPWPIGETLAKWEKQGIGTNALLLVGHGTVRRQVLGMQDRKPTKEELERMVALVEQGMREGAFGLSTGLYYAPGSYADAEEVIALARAAARYGGIYDSHIRDESNYSIGLLAAIEEAISIGERAGLPVHIAHLKALGRTSWGKAPEACRLIERARRRGIEVTADQYPYEASGTSIAGALVPRWALAGGAEALRSRLKDRTASERLRPAIAENIERRGGADSLLISSARDKSLEGKRLSEVAAAWQVAPEEAAMRMLEQGDAGLISFNMSHEDIVHIMKKEYVMTSSDGETEDPRGGRAHPRSYGAFPRKIRKYVYEENVISLPFAVRAATSLPAAAFRISNRGLIVEGYCADLLVFDGEEFGDKASYSDPHQYSEGVVHLVVNGRLAIENRQYTGALAGRALRRGR